MEVAVGVAAVDPAVEARALLEGGVAFAEEVGFGDADAAQGVAHRRPGAFADADRGDAGRFDQRDAQPVFGRQHAGHQPAGGTAADHHDVLDGIAHCCILCKALAESNPKKLFLEQLFAR
jgi:hypothetical protein